MANINKMSIEEIFNAIGQSVKPSQVLQVFNGVTGLFKFIEKDDAMMKNIDPAKFIEQCSDFVDKERLACVIGMNLKEALLDDKKKQLNPLEKHIYEVREKQFKKCLELLEYSNAEVPYFECNNGIYRIKEFYSVSELFDRKKDTSIKEKNMEMFQKAQDEGILLAIIEASAYEYGSMNIALKHGNSANIIGQLISYNLQKIEEQKGELSNTEKKDIISEQLEDFFKTHIEKINMDKFLLVSAYNARNILETTGIDDRSVYIKILKFANENIKDRKLRISNQLDDISIKYSVKELEKNVKKIVTPDIYVCESAKEALKNAFLEGKYKKIDSDEYTEKMIEADLILLKYIDITEKEKKQIIANNFINIESFYKSGFLNRDEIKQWLGEIEDKQLEIGFVDYLYNDGTIQKHDFIDLYMAKNLKLSEIIDMDVLYDINSQVSVDELMDYYVQHLNDVEKEKNFDRYALLFKALKIKNQDENRKEIIGEQIVEEMYTRECDDKSDWKKLYQADLLPIKTLISWNGERIIYDLIEQNSLKPQDTKQLLISGQLDINKVCDTLEKSNLSDAEKLNFIFSSFDGTGKSSDEIELQNNARNKLIQTISISNTMSNHKINSGGGRIVDPRPIVPNSSNKFIINPAHRWELFKKIDKDFKTDACSDGTVIFTLPNVDNGTVVIEKILKNSKFGNKLDYGSATYIMSEEEFLKNKRNIVSDKKIHRTALINMHGEGKAYKAVHSQSWGKQIKEKLHISQKNKYSEEKINEIDDLISKIEKTRELIG